MNKILLIILTFLVFGFGFNNAVCAKNQIKFIYIHGTNDNNVEKQNMFTDDVKTLHPYIVKEFNNSEVAKKYLLENGKYEISDTPLAFYWGGESKEDLNLLADWLDLTKFFSPKLAQNVRSMLAHVLHDAIWIQKYNNMKPIIDRLHSITATIRNDGDKYVLLGHSAGSFITYEYLLYKMPYVPTKSFFKNSKLVTSSMYKQLDKIGFKNICVDALVDSDIAVYKRDNTLEVKPNNLINKYKNLDKVAKTSCASMDNFTGVINFGSPVTLFYSGFYSVKDIDNSILISSIMNSNLFFLNMNFAEDPLGFPIVNENDYQEILAYTNNHGNSGNNSKLKYGFIYDKSDLRSNKSVISAHSAYWKKCKFFSKSIVKAYETGINTFSSQAR